MIENFIVVGAHSIRKGISSFLSAFPGGPTAIAIYLRAGWSLGRVTSRYIFGDQGQDQFTGRCCTGISTMDPKFAELPPHFHPSLSIDFKSILPCYDQLPLSFRPVLPFLLASLCNGEEFLVKNLNPKHPFFSAPVWTQRVIHQMKGHVRTGSISNHETGLVATGIPPSVILNGKVETVSEQMELMRNQFMVTLENGLKAMPKAVVEEVSNRVSINGLNPVTQEGVQNIINGALSLFSKDMYEKFAFLATNGLSGQKKVADIEDNPAPLFQQFCWGGRLHCVPSDFNFPR